MATKQLVAEQLLRISSVHRTKLDEQLVEEYYKVLGACLPDDLIQAADQVIATNKYFPKVAEIWEASENVLIKRLANKYGMANVNIAVAE